MVSSQGAFTALVAAVAVQRLVELAWSRRQERRLLLAGGRVHGGADLAVLAAVHTGWLAGMLLEVQALQRPFLPAVAIPALAVFALGQTLRYAAMRALGWRWCVKVVTLPGAPPVTGGVYRWLRHPNYAGVVLEMAALPLVHGAWLTALVASAVHGVAIAWRIRIEERALAGAGDYVRALGGRPRLWPRWRPAARGGGAAPAA
ncbi:MAG: isoprenylcysteine carboxyl methyltransferase [Planctomycetota bacterium]|nr:MAG: isoprenylcysteine carboxyl methyltransferase [Planctomycetota bacterium]